MGTVTRWALGKTQHGRRVPQSRRARWASAGGGLLQVFGRYSNTFINKFSPLSLRGGHNGPIVIFGASGNSWTIRTPRCAHSQARGREPGASEGGTVPWVRHRDGTVPQAETGRRGQMAIKILGSTERSTKLCCVAVLFPQYVEHVASPAGTGLALSCEERGTCLCCQPRGTLCPAQSGGTDPGPPHSRCSRRDQKVRWQAFLSHLLVL